MANFKIAKMIFKSFFNKPATDPFPNIPKKYFDETRGHIEINGNDCILCGICAKKCPADAISVDREFSEWKIERMKCVQCSCCVNVCPKKCLFNDSAYTSPDSVKVVSAITIPKGKANASGGGNKSELTVDTATCIYCGICAKKCPSEAIVVDRKEKKWEVNKDACTKCGLCIDSCPKKSLTFK